MKITNQPIQGTKLKRTGENYNLLRISPGASDGLKAIKTALKDIFNRLEKEPALPRNAINIMQKYKISFPNRDTLQFTTDKGRIVKLFIKEKDNMACLGINIKNQESENEYIVTERDTVFDVNSDAYCRKVNTELGNINRIFKELVYKLDYPILKLRQSYLRISGTGNARIQSFDKAAIDEKESKPMHTDIKYPRNPLKYNTSEEVDKIIRSLSIKRTEN